MIKVVGYKRVSTASQVTEGEGLEIQQQRIEAFCAKNNYEIVNMFSDEGVSGAKEVDERPGIRNLLAFCNNPPVEYVVIDKPDRLSRDYFHMLYIEKQLLINNVRVLYAVQDSLNGDDMFVDAMRKMMGIFAELDRKMINKRLSDGKRKKAENGNKPAGRQPFGYEYSADKKSTVINQHQARIIKDMFNMRASGKIYQVIADTLNKRRYTTDRVAYTGNNQKRKWSMQTVQVALHNDYYIGKITHDGKKMDGNHKAIINMDVWNTIHPDSND